MSVMYYNQKTIMDALVPHREVNVKAAIGEVFKLPTFEDSMKELEEQVKSENYADFNVEFRELSMLDNGFLDIGGTPLMYTKHALNQATSRIRPEGVVGLSGYLAVCPPGLRADNFNFWHQDRFAEANVSTRGNNVKLRLRQNAAQKLLLRAVVSQSYAIIDDLPILRGLQGVLDQGARMRAVRGDMKSRFDVIWPTMSFEVQPGDVVFAAMRVINSETGASSVRLEPVVYHASSYRYYMIPRGGTDVAIRHIGEAKKRFEAGYAQTIDRIAPFVASLKESYVDSVDANFDSMDKMWNALGVCFDLPDTRVATIKAAFDTAPVPNRGGVADAMTRAATDMSVEDAEGLQMAAGQLISNGWNQVKRHVEED